ncbi:BAQ_1a_G0031090.mRNA.1.CDS.1 [Saccharomyces cerevisiae]|nr:BAQ_1a_G0031090.mRNA.1.CDS.1 [Saccharomyces cerevisiae]CAI7189608.1 BAQ_1a_G0031090.mRNA.1.CDS.1 [Saccharomyces cerevisiae]
MSCQEAFRTTLLEPFSLKKDEAAKVKSFKDSVPYIEEALEVYFTEVEKQWKLFNSEKSWSPVGLEDAKLPKEAYRFKLTWVLKRISNIFMLIPFLNFLCCIYVSRGMCLLLRTFYLGWILFMLVQGFQNMRMIVLSVKMEHKMQFLSTIINEQESGANGWDEIAKKMNRYLFEKKVWKNEEFFFDGIDCEWFFSHFFYRVLSVKKSMRALSLNVELWPYIKEAQLSCSEESLA